MLELALLDGSEKRFAIEEGAELLVGVAAHCRVRLTAFDVSRSHALITCQSGKILLLDLGSTNGTYVNGKRVREAELAAGDAIRFSSVPAQVLPPAREANGVHAATARNCVPAGNGATPDGVATPEPGNGVRDGHGAGDVRVPTDDRAEGINEESLDGLLARWGTSAEAAQAVFVEWLVTRGGMRGAAVLESVGDEVVVAAAHGDVNAVLEDPRCAAVVRGGTTAGSAIEGIDLLLGQRRVVALKAPNLPWLFLMPGTSTPDSGALSLAIRLLAVARRIDLSDSP